MTENTNTASFNITQKLPFTFSGDQLPELSGGAFFESKTRDFSGRNLGYVRANSSTFDQNLIYVPIDVLFSENNINPDTGIKIDEQTNPSDSYDSENKLNAFYLMLKLPIAGKINISAGARLEDNTMRLESASLTNEPIIVNDHILSLLPSINISYNFSEKTLARIAYGRTVNRPEFRELAPFGFYDFNYNLVRKGNPELNSATIDNLDLRYEYYPENGEMISFGLFYKKFSNPIELSFLPGGGTAGIKTFIPVNAAGAISVGSEIEIRKSLQSLTSNPFLQRFTLLFNGALIYSRITAKELGTGPVFEERPMQGQSPYIINTGLYYRDADRQLQVNLLYNIIGKRIMIIGFTEYPDIYEMPRHHVDLTISKGFGRFIEIKAGIKDIFNQPNILLQDANQDGSFDRNIDQVIEQYTPGTIFTLGISFKL
jgi:TonB-dependent receptor